MPVNPKYYLNNTPEVQLDGRIIGVGASALEEALVQFYKSGGSGVTKTLRVLAKGNVFSQVVVESIDIIFNDDELIIGGAVFDATATIAITTAIMAGFTALGVPAYALMGVSVAVAGVTSFVYSTFIDEPVENFFDALNGTIDVNIQLYDSDGIQIAGVLYKDGLTEIDEIATGFQELLFKGDVPDFPKIEAGMTIKVLEAEGNSESLRNEYTVHDGAILEKVAEIFDSSLLGIGNVPFDGQRLKWGVLNPDQGDFPGSTNPHLLIEEVSNPMSGAGSLQKN